MRTNTLLVLGASQYQLETIETAKRLGYRVVCTDNIPTNPGHARADRSYLIDTTDREAVLSMARGEGVDGVISPCTDAAVATAAFIAQQMGLVGPPLAAAEVVTDKLAFRHFLRSNGFPTTEFFELPTALESVGAVFAGRPWIVKPCRSSGSKGIFIVDCFAELEARLSDTLAFSPDGRAVIEAFISGLQGTCEGVVREGKVVLACLLDRQTVAPPYVATSGHRVPTCLPEDARQQVVDMLERLWLRLGVADAVFDCDFVASGAEVHILEVSPRLGGNCISGLLFKASDFNFTEYAIRLACGESPRVPESLALRPMAVLILGTPRSGFLHYDEAAVERLAQTEWVDTVTMDVAPGTPVQAFTNGRNRIGQCFLRGNSYQDLVTRSDEVVRRLHITATESPSRGVR